MRLWGRRKKIVWPAQQSTWHHYNKKSDTVIIFVHGIFSNREKAWTHDKDGTDESFWPDLILSDDRFLDPITKEKPSIFLASYYSALGSGRFGIREAAEAVYKDLKYNDDEGHQSVLANKRVVFIGHSQGGIVSRYILYHHKDDFVGKEVGLVLIASPSRGSVYADMLADFAEVYDQVQAKQLQTDNGFLDDLHKNFKDIVNIGSIPSLKGVEAYEEKFYVELPSGIPLKAPRVVTSESAGQYFGAATPLPGTDHSTCVQPSDKKHITHKTLAQFWQENFSQPIRIQTETKEPIQVEKRFFADFVKQPGDLRLKSGAVPRPPNHYIERTELLSKIKEGLKSGTGIALYGGQIQLQASGGYGKSVLAYAYAASTDHPDRSYVVSCRDHKTVEDALAELLVNNDDKAKLSEIECAEQVCLLLAEKPSLLVLDNVEDESQWRGYQESGYLDIPGCDVLITTRDRNVIGLESIPVDRLTVQEMRDLLGKFLPSANDSKYDNAMKVIHQETGGLALVVAAIGVVRKHFDKSDDWNAYAKFLETANIHDLPCDDHTRYDQTADMVIDDLQSRLEPAQVRILEYVAYLPPDSIRSSWIETLIQKDVEKFGLDLGQETTKQPHTPAWHLERLREYDILRPISASESMWSVHRLHRKQAWENIRSDRADRGQRQGQLQAVSNALFRSAYDSQIRSHITTALDMYGQSIEIRQALRTRFQEDGQWNPQFQNDLASAYTNRGNAYQNVPNLEAAIQDYAVAIEIREAVRNRLEQEGQWNPKFQNDLASTYTNRGNAYQDVPNLETAIQDYAVAIEIMQAIRTRLEEKGQWHPEFPNSLAGTYTNRGVAYQNVPNLEAAIQDYAVAIEIREAVRNRLEQEGQWNPKFQNDLASTYTNRGNAYQDVPNLEAAIQDYAVAIEIREAVRTRLEQEGHWNPQFQNDLASTYMNRGVAYQNVPNLEAAIQDYAVAIEIMKAVRTRLEQEGQWNPQFQNDLANAYMNRGVAYQNVPNLEAAIQDYAVAIEIREAIRTQLEPLGFWTGPLRTDYITALRNRAIAWSDMGRDEEARNDLTKADEITGS